ncbi:MAG: hypothetical protein ACO2PP_01900 [Thermocrinis sp.]|jgi:hypothetical protein|uniref:hypothetical protein n=1 Tax=Thermocrinis sp. TaxID=2024383 RepID=UPI003C081DA8
MVLVKGIGEGLPVPEGGWRVKKTKGGNAMEERKHEQKQLKRIAEKLLRGEALSMEEALLLTDREAVYELYFILHQIIFWGI